MNVSAVIRMSNGPDKRVRIGANTQFIRLPKLSAGRFGIAEYWWDGFGHDEQGRRVYREKRKRA